MDDTEEYMDLEGMYMPEEFTFENPYMWRERFEYKWEPIIKDFKWNNCPFNRSGRPMICAKTLTYLGVCRDNHSTTTCKKCRREVCYGHSFHSVCNTCIARNPDIAKQVGTSEDYVKEL